MDFMPFGGLWLLLALRWEEIEHRYARGEIDRTTHRQMQDDLKKRASA